jgi:shikimate dehydrogenase
VSEILELGAEGWLLDGAPWEPHGAFYGVMGDPVGHSRSPAMHNAALADREIDADYLAIRIQPGQLKGLKSGPQGQDLAGFNATAPLKEAVSALCDGRTDQARSLGAVNTVKVEDGKWLGHNTDSGGILAVLSQAWDEAAPPERAVVLGAGGSARAATDAVARWGVGKIEVRNRSAAGQDRVRTWVQRQDFADRTQVTSLRTEEPASAVSTVWICCLAGGVPTQPFLPVAAGSSGDLLLDLRYGNQLPTEEPPLGFRYHDGKTVLLMQGGLSFGWWFGPPIPWPAMSAAIG